MVDYTLDFFLSCIIICMVPSSSPLQEIEPRLRHFLPADLYSRAWVDTFLTPQERAAQDELAAAGKELTKEQQTLQEVFEHLQSLQRILYDYTSRGLSEKLSENPPARPDEEPRPPVLSFIGLGPAPDAARVQPRPSARPAHRPAG